MVKQTINEPREIVEALANEAIKVAKTARKHKKSLNATGFYAIKMAGLGTQAEMELRRLTSSSPALDSSLLRNLVVKVFAPTTDYADRSRAKLDLVHELKTRWLHPADLHKVDDGLFPMSLLEKTRRGYLVSVGTQMNGCFNAGWCDASAVMMRRLLEMVIIDAFVESKLGAKIQDSQGNFWFLRDLVNGALGETTWTLSHDTKRVLPNLKDFGDSSAHGKTTMQKTEIERIQYPFRKALEEFLHIAKFL
jgi:hypothetical protein